MNRSVYITACALAAMLVTASAHAEVITIEGAVKSVDAATRTITVDANGEEKTLDVSRKAKVSVSGKAAALGTLKSGQSVKLSYHDDLEIVLKIEATATSGSASESIALFDGKTLKGWNGDKSIWKVRNGTIVGSLPGQQPSGSFLSTKASYDNFVLSVRFKLSEGNSGVQFRSQRLQKNAMAGYQADIAWHDNCKYLGWLHGERMGGKIAEPAPGTRQQLINAVDQNDWNDCVITANGDQIAIEINGIKAVDVQHDGPIDGAIGFQLHGGMPTTVAFKDIMLTPLP